MLHRYWFCAAVVILNSVLMAGCAGHSGAVRSSAQKSNTPPASTSTSGSVADEREEKAAKAHAHYAAGIVHDMNDDTEAALRDYYAAATADPGNERLVLEVSRRFLQNKQPEKAQEILERAASRPNASGAVMARLGLVYLQLGKTDQAVHASRAAIKRSPESLAGYQNLFLHYLQSKQTPEALKILEEAAKQPNADADFLLGLAELYGSLIAQTPAQKEKLKPEVLAVLSRAGKIDPLNASQRLRLAEGFNAFGETDKAAQIYLDLLKALPDLPLVRERVHARLAGIFLRESDHKRAVEQLEALVRDDPTNPQAYYYLGYLAYNDKNSAQAADYFSKAILLNPGFEDAYYDLALAQISLDKPAEALATLEKARKQFQKNFVMEVYTGLAYSRQKEYREAVKHYTEAEIIAKATDPTRLGQEFYFQLGAAYERIGDFEQSEQYFEKCLQLKPDFPEAQNYLGYMWAEHGIKLDKARELIEKAVKAEPKNAAYLDSLGWVLFKLDKPQEALNYVLKAVALTEEPDATLYEHLGDIYAALSQPEKAREAWTKSLAVEPNDAVKKKLEVDSHPEETPKTNDGE
ncbi:MAG TPA: tetratricopeptide repeat protein [Candidatus Limnocylindrales bacterium]|jgi:tetratricopeptide (TPR) repeat protein|nr:tetratricopeptide repeat protein [Candidatus Limnocylindrales bacterium]